MWDVPLSKPLENTDNLRTIKDLLQFVLVTNTKDIGGIITGDSICFWCVAFFH